MKFEDVIELIRNGEMDEMIRLGKTPFDVYKMALKYEGNLDGRVAAMMRLGGELGLSEKQLNAIMDIIVGI